MGKKRAGAREHGGAKMPHVFEGDAVLTELLAAAGSPLTVRQVRERMKVGHGHGAPAAQLVAGLFESEPRFSSPDLALRLYGNLFGLWDSLTAPEPSEPVAKKGPTRGEPKREHLPAPAPIDQQGPLTEAFVEAAWRHVADLPQRDLERLMHRYENTQPELTEWVREEAGEAVVVHETADTLCFELWAFLEMARTKKLRTVLRSDLDAAREDAPKLDPALEAYLAEAIEEAKLDDDEALAPVDAERVGRIVRAAVNALSPGR